jgi:hypothetical protein
MQLLAAALVVAALDANPAIIAQQGGRLTPVEATMSEKLTPELALMIYQRCAAFFSARSLLLISHKADRAEARAVATASAFRVGATRLAEKYQLDLGEAAMETTLEGMIGDYIEEFALSGNATGIIVTGTLKADHDFCMSLD